MNDNHQRLFQCDAVSFLKMIKNSCCLGEEEVKRCCEPQTKKMMQLSLIRLVLFFSKLNSSFFQRSSLGINMEYCK